MKTAEEIETFLIETNSNYEVVGDNIWIVKDGGPDLVVSIAGPVLVFRVKIIDDNAVKEGQREALYRKLLELNATEMLHGSYGLEEGSVVLTSALQLENLDFNEFQAAIEDMSLAVGRHYPVLARFAN